MNIDWIYFVPNSDTVTTVCGEKDPVDREAAI